MAKIVLNCPNGIPKDHYSQEFLQKMVNSFAHGFYTYGHSDGRGRMATDKMAPMWNIDTRLKKYRDSKNTDFLVDVANYAMFEFMYPTLAGAYYTPTTEKQSPGSVLKNKRHIKSQEVLLSERKRF